MIRLAVLTPAEIAERRFMPALLQSPDFSFVGVGMRRKEKAEKFLSQYPGRLFESYDAVVDADDVDAIYIPLPPALHFAWAKEALLHGKHVLLEKPFTVTRKEAEELLSLAKERSLALHENYMFIYHKQFAEILHLIQDGAIGDVRLYRMSFGFPMRPAGDFRYDKALGGGALSDAGGYCLKAATWLLGETAHVTAATANFVPEFPVDLFGSATVVNEDGVTAQLSFGMDNNYKCSLEIWGSKGTLATNRFFTAPAGFTPTAVIEKNGEHTEVALSPDDTFLKSIEAFHTCITKQAAREANYRAIETQAKLMEAYRELAGL